MVEQEKGEEETISCLYDELFSGEMAAQSIEECFSAVLDFVKRNYCQVMHSRDWSRATFIAEKGNSAIKLAFMLLVETHEQAIHDQIVLGCANEETQKKAHVFRRLLCIATRSLFETPFDEDNAPSLVSRYLQVCHLCWTSMDHAALENFCDFFSSRTKIRRKCANIIPTLATDEQLSFIASRCGHRPMITESSERLSNSSSNKGVS
jgi:hypothetical protein